MANLVGVAAATSVSTAVATTMMATGIHGICGATSPAGVNSGSVGTEPSSDCAAIQPYATPSTSPVRVAATVMCVASSSTIRRTWRLDRPIERSSPSSGAAAPPRS